MIIHFLQIKSREISAEYENIYRAFVACLLGILEEDAELISENIQVLCELLAGTDITSFEKLQCQFAYGMLAIAYNNLPQDIYELIRMPEYKDFDLGYMKWLIEGNFTKEAVLYGLRQNE